MKDQNGISKLQGKRFAVGVSLNQDTLFFGNLNKEWSVEEFDELIHKAFKDVVSVDLAMASHVDSSISKKHVNRGFGFVRFSSHAAALRVLRIGSRTDLMIGGLHPAINWADRESHVDADEMARSKTAFVGNLPENVNEEYLQKLFEHIGEVTRVAISRKGQYPVGFVHFASRAELDNAIKEMDGKTVRGPNRGPTFRIQVSVAQPAVENNKKRIREEVKTRGSNVSRDRQDYSHARYGHEPFDRRAKAPILSNEVAGITDPYDTAIISLPSAVKELLLRILRLGIGTRYDIDIHCIKSLNGLPESVAVAVLNQFLIAGADKRNKGDYFASLIAKHQVKTFGRAQILQDTTYLSRNYEINSKQFRDEDYGYMIPRSSRYSPLGDYPLSSYTDGPTMSQSRIRRYAEERHAVSTYPEPRSRQEGITSIGRYHEPRLAHEPREDAVRNLDRRYIHEHSSNSERYAKETVLSRERRFSSAADYSRDIGPEFSSRSSEDYSTECQIRFDPFTGVPYKFDPFTGEPIRPESNLRRSGNH